MILLYLYTKSRQANGANWGRVVFGRNWSHFGAFWMADTSLPLRGEGRAGPKFCLQSFWAFIPYFSARLHARNLNSDREMRIGLAEDQC